MAYNKSKLTIEDFKSDFTFKKKENIESEMHVDVTRKEDEKFKWDILEKQRKKIDKIKKE